MDAVTKPISRAEKRHRDRTNQEVQQVINQLSDQFMSFFLECEDPEGEEVVNKMKDISAKWRVFCKRKNLIAKAYPVLDEVMAKIVNDFLTERQNALKPEKAGLNTE